MKRDLSKLALGFFMLVHALTATAAEWVELETKVLDDGWFRYRLRVYDHPFIIFTQFHSADTEFPGWIESIAPANWTNSNPDWGIGWEHSGPIEEMPYEAEFLARSSATHFRSNAFMTILSVAWNDEPLGAVGYINFASLAPCSAAEADGSPRSVVSRINIGDIKIDELIVTNNQVYGVRFSTDGNCTVQLEGSHNLKTWDPIGRFWGVPPTTTWTTNLTLNSQGRFFRLALVASYHMPLEASRMASSGSTQKRAKVLECVPRKDSVEAVIATTPDVVYQVQLKDVTGKLVQESTVTAKDPVTKVTFPQASNVSAFFVEALVQ